MKKGTIAYQYLFNYFGKSKLGDKTILDASIDLAIKVSKDGKEILFDKEPQINGMYLLNIYNVSFDKENVYRITENPQIKDLMRLGLNADNIEYEVVGYYLGYLAGFGLGDKEIEESLPEQFRNMPVSEPMSVTKEEFETFLRENAEGFDNVDNKRAQVPSYCIIPSNTDSNA